MTTMLHAEHEFDIVDLTISELDAVDGGMNVWGVVRGVGTAAGGVVMIGAGVSIAGGSGGLAAVGGGVVAAFGAAAVLSGTLQAVAALSE